MMIAGPATFMTCNQALQEFDSADNDAGYAMLVVTLGCLVFLGAGYRMYKKAKGG